MLIDTHTHIFPDKIAKNAIASLEEKAKEGSGENAVRANTDGTLSGLLRSMAESGTDHSLVLPVVTKPSQFDSVNRFASEINGKNGIFSFGGIHPDCDDISEKLEYIKSLGLKGVKLHPDYQGFFVDEEKCVRTVRECLRLGLYVVFHAGFDVGFPDPIHCTPKRFAKAFSPILREFGEEKRPHIILAHLGGITSVKETLEHLCGLPVLLDTAFTLEQMDTDEIMSVIRKHGAEKILYATDSPWQSQTVCRKRLGSLPLSEKEYELISHENAEKILF